MECHLCISITQHWHVVWKKTTRGLSKKIETSSKINKPSFPHPNLISFTIVRKENRNLRKIPTPQLVKYKYYKKILHIPQCWYHHQSYARLRQADNESTAAYSVEEASKVFFTTKVQYPAWKLSDWQNNGLNFSFWYNFGPEKGRLGVLAPLPSTWWHCRHSGDFDSAISAACACVARAAKFSFSKNRRDLKNEYFFLKICRILSNTSKNNWKK